jgi:predicted DNA-binding transcriptional regulator YafY
MAGRVFKLARMHKLQVLKETFTPREFPPLPMDGADWMNQEVVPVTIRVNLSIMDQVIERYGESNIINTEGNTCLASFPIAHNEYGYDRLLRFGDKCEVISPPEVRDGFRSYVQRILQQYEG